MHSLRDEEIVLNQNTIDHTIVLAPNAFIHRHLAIARLAETDYSDLIMYVMSKLEQSKVFSHGWWPKTKIDTQSEDAIFAALQPITDKIHDACVEWDNGKGQLGKATARMQYDSSQILCCDYLERPRKTNAHFVLVDSSANAPYRAQAPLVDWSSVGRCRKSPALRAETETCIVAAASIIMETDPCRRFMNAFTIEGTKMRLWHFSRSHIAMAEEFDYHNKPEHFIRYLIFMTFASREELGYDPTVTRVKDANGRTQYQFRIGDKIYQTLRTLAALRRIDIIYKAPRVWAVMELHPETKAPIGEVMVLKDFWADAGVKSELEIQTGIFDALRRLDEDRVGDTPGLLEEAKKFFMRIVEDAPVPFNGVDDTAPAPDNDATIMHYAATYGVGSMPQPSSTPCHTTMIHRRIIFGEECMTMDEVSNYSHLALAMAQLIQALDYLRLARYLHHDVSVGNCLVHVTADGRRQLKISDLEFARPYESPFEEDGLTGTPQFMAVEYELGHHLFVPRIERRKTFFRYNFAHDLEAALWIYVWFILNKIPDCLDPEASARQRSKIQYCRDELLEEEDSPQRRALVTKDVASHTAFRRLSALYDSVPKGSYIVSALKSFDVLADLYKTVERTEPIDIGVPGLTRWDSRSFSRQHYILLRDQFMALHHHLSGVRYCAVSHGDFELAAAEAAAQRVQKRERDDEEDEDEETEVVAKKLCMRMKAGQP